MISRLTNLFIIITVIHVGICHIIVRQDAADTDFEISTSDDCICVEFYLCGADNYIITSGENLTDIRVGGQNTECMGSEVCCRLRKETTTTATTNTIATTTTTASTTTASTTTASTTTASTTIVTTATVTTPVDLERRCGIRRFGGLTNNVLDTRILPTEGQAGFGEFPWMAAVLMNNEDILLFVCGASVIRQNVVLTAAHCVDQLKASDIKIRAGEWDLTSEVESLPYQERFVSKIIIHPDFNPESLKNDIALLVLTSPLILTGNVAPVCLPRDGIDINETNCIATGWGKNSFGQKGQHQKILKMTELPLVPNDECQARLRTTRLSKYFELHNSFICAGGETNIDTCKGDGGGPLVCSSRGSDPPIYIQMGITSWGIGCGGPIPAVYTYVFAELPWLTVELANIS